jgi:nitroreductase
MNTLEAIAARRSIRRFLPTPVPRELVERILEAAIQAPSGKNRQPWRFVVVEGSKRDELASIMRKATREGGEHAISTRASSRRSTNAIERAPITILVFNGESPNDTPEADWRTVDIQSIGGAIQTMLLAAQDLGLGSLWICDVYRAYDDICAWLGRADQMVAAVTIGYANEAPPARPRKQMGEVTTWLGE